MTATRDMIVVSGTDLDEKEVELGVGEDEIATARAVLVLYQRDHEVLGVSDLAFYYVDLARGAYFKRESLGLLLERLYDESPRFWDEILRILGRGNQLYISASLYDPTLPSILYESAPESLEKRVEALVELLEKHGRERLVECDFMSVKKARVKVEDIEWYFTQYQYRWLSALRLLRVKHDYGVCRDAREPCILVGKKCYVKVR